MQAGYGVVADTFVRQFLVYIVESYFVELVYGYGDVDDAVALAYYLGYAGQYLAVIDFYRYPDA